MSRFDSARTRWEHEVMSTQVDLHVRGGIVVPMVRDRDWFQGDILVRGGRIIEVIRGPAVGVDATEVIDADDDLVLPGLIQGHVHVVQSLLRHQADGLELLDWLRHRTWPYEASLDGDGVEVAAELGIAELLTGGTTTALDFGTTRHHDRVFVAAERMGIRLCSGKTHMDIGDDVPRGLLEDTDRSLEDAVELGEKWHSAAGGRLRYAVAPRFALSCSRRLLEGCAELARSRGWLLQSHAAENRAEVAAVRELTGRSNIGFLDDVGLTGSDVVLAHGVHLDPEEMSILARTGTRVCHCPGANLKLASGIADLPGLWAAGVVVALGADGPPCNNRLSVFNEMSLAGSIHGLRHGPTAVDPWAVLAMATREGAQALHLASELGTLEPGKAADLVVLGGHHWSLLPDGDPASRVVYGGSALQVRHVAVAGKLLVCDGALTTVDEPELVARVREGWLATRRRMEEVA